MRSPIWLYGVGILALLACGDRGAERRAERDLPPVASQPAPAAKGSTAATSGAKAWANVEPTQASGAPGPRGTLRFEPTGDGVRVQGSIENLPPGEHTLYVSTRGDCNAVDAGATDRFKFAQGEEGLAGSLGELRPDSSGRAELEGVVRGAKIEGERSLVGHAVIVHESAGKSIGCGVIES